MPEQAERKRASARKPTAKNARTSAARSPATSNGPRSKVTVRMYRVGFGDAFLLRIPTSQGEKKVLIDCGSIKQDQHSIKEIVGKIIDDVDGSIDLVICTHRHRDHVSGFADPRWASVKVGEVWMPWTEHPTDPRARKIREAQAGLALHLQAQALAAVGARPELEAVAELAANALSNAEAMATLHDGFSGNPAREFLPGKDRGTATLTTRLLPGVTVYVMGPSRDPDVIRDMNPPQGESYMRLMAAQPGQRDTPEPFGNDWAVDAGLIQSLNSRLPLSPADIDHIVSASRVDELAVATSLDAAVNGTSLMLVFKVGKTHFLFPGDAQWGTWEAALGDDEWREILGQTKFYKVGHHGSHNATPIDFVEHTIGNDFYAMASVKPVAKWKSIPRAPLVAALEKRTKKFIRSDQPENAEPGTYTSDGDGYYCETAVPVAR